MKFNKKFISGFILLLVFMISEVSPSFMRRYNTYREKWFWETAKNLYNKGKEALTNLGNAIKEKAEDAYNGVKDIYYQLKDKYMPSKEWISNNTKQNHNFDINKRIKEFSLPLAKYFEKYAGFAYCEYEKVKSNTCCPELLEKAGWSKVYAEGFPKINYDFSIIKSDKYKKVIVGFPGTRGGSQLLTQMVNSGLTNFEGSSSIRTLTHFTNIYSTIKESVFKNLKSVYQKNPDYQYIFTGHSLGGAMSTLFAYGTVKNNIIKKTVDSPVLITFGQPRVGNDIFANEVMKNVAIIFRIARQGDAVASIPFCDGKSLVSNICNTVLPQSQFVKSTMTNSSSYYWHVGGLILFHPDMTRYNDCGNTYGENDPSKACDIQADIDFDLHKFYFDKNKKVSQICRPNNKKRKFKKIRK